MLRRLCIAALVVAAALAVVTPARANAAPRFGTTSLPPVHPTKMSAQSVGQAAFPYADTFKLHSLPGAQRVIYLDFNGETIDDTAWNDEWNDGATVVAPAYDTDGNTAAFSNGELDLIQSAWQRVAEDFAPFNVDVTTQDPGLAAIDRSGAGDLFYGTKALITNTTFIYNECGCAGVGYIDVFDAPAPYHQYYQPALIFGKAIGAYDKDLADAISHEVGHNLGLDHDGKGGDDYYTGHGAWAPLMGASYYRPVTQWSKGEYTSATNLQDDITVMQQGGIPLRADDHGNTTATASLFSPAGTSTGVISSDADVDVFSYVSTGASPTFSATPATKGPNLDIKLEILDATGSVLALADPVTSATNFDTATGLGASTSVAMAAGQTYYVRVQGVGSGNVLTDGYSGYGSLGQYTLTGPALASLPTLSINDVVVNEGQSGLTPVNFTASLSEPSLLPVTFLASTLNVSALSSSDFVPLTAALVTIPPGETSAVVPVQANGDTTPEAHEKFKVVLASPLGALLGDSAGFGYLANDDIGIGVGSVTKFEGPAGTNTIYTFTVSLSSASASTIGVTASTVNWTAVSGSDYTAKSVVMTFAPGQTTKTMTVVVRGDATKENGEKFFVNLTNPTGPGAVITSALGTGLIKNDDF